MTVINLDSIDAPPTCGIATDEERALLDWADSHPITTGAPEAADGRYVLADPDTGEDAKWTRVTTFIEAIDDGTGLTKWKLGLTVRGLVLSDQLMRQARAEHDNDKACRDIAERAHLWAGSKLSAAVGTALHTATEHHDLGTGHRPPAPWDLHVDAWAGALAAHGIEVVPGWIERIVVNPEVGCAGTLDRLVRLPDGRVVVLDIKTGVDKTDDDGKVKRSAIKKATYAVQAGVYANSTHAWTPDGYEALPDDLDRTTAIIAHLSAETGECEMWMVDAAEGWQRAKVALAVREARRIGGLFTRMEAVERNGADDDPVKVGDLLPALEESIRERGLDPADPDAGTDHAERAAEARARIKALGGDEVSKARVTRAWPVGVPHRPPWTVDQLDAIETMLHGIDGGDSSFLGDPDPELVAKAQAKRETADATFFPPTPEPTRVTADPQPDGDPVSDEEVSAIKAATRALPKERAQRVAAWMAEAKRGGHPWGSTTAMGERTFSLCVAAVRCVTELWDDEHPDALTRAALHLVIGEELQPTWTTGAVLGSLTIAEAERLDELAATYAADPETTRAIGSVVAQHLA